LILTIFLELGKKWTDISKQLTGRTETSVKNRFNCLIKKERDAHKSELTCGIDQALDNINKQKETDEFYA
jgi:hypothetical protein